MRPVRILTDSCSDLSGELLTKHNITYARMNTVLKGKETPASLTWEYYAPKALYDIMRTEKSAEDRIRTTQVPVEEFTRIFTGAAEAGEDVVYIGCATKQSGSVNTAAVVAKDMVKKFPEMSIFCIDSLNSCMGEGILVLEAAKLRDEGMDAAAIVEKITGMRKNVLEYITVNTLDYLKRAGRVKASAAFFGNLMGVKPILIADKNGEQTPIKKVKGRATSLSEIVNLLKANMINPGEQTVYLVHADCDQAEVEAFRQQILKETGCREVYVNYIGPIVGASIGPGAIGAFAFGKEVTFEA